MKQAYPERFSRIQKGCCWFSTLYWTPTRAVRRCSAGGWCIVMILAQREADPTAEVVGPTLYARTLKHIMGRAVSSKKHHGPGRHPSLEKSTRTHTRRPLRSRVPPQAPPPPADVASSSADLHGGAPGTARRPSFRRRRAGAPLGEAVPRRPAHTRA